MKKFTLFLIFLIPTLLYSQVAYSPLIEEIITQTDGDKLSQLDKEFSGELPTIVQGEEYTFVTRHAYTEGNEQAAYWIKEHFEALGLDTRFMDYSSTGRNVIATIPGSVYPEKEYIICAHYDNMPPNNTAPGADDNASGVCAVLEAARLLKDYESIYTLKFIGFDEEEIGLVGSYAYADSAVANNETILGVLNLDMIAWDSDNDNEFSIATNTLSTPLTNDYVTIYQYYVPELSHNFISTTSSDHSPFWNKGYQAILAIEDFGDFHQFYHTPQDDFSHINVPYFTHMTRAAIASLATLGWNYKVDIQHNPIPSSNSTEAQIASFSVSSDYSYPSGENQPRLYYRINNGEFQALTPDSSIDDEFTFTIPGQLMDTDIDYYFAIQNQEASLIASAPQGGKGINPPGTIAPEDYFSYSIDDIYNTEFESTSDDLAIEDNLYVFDTIHIETAGNILDLNVKVNIEHSYNQDIRIMLKSPEGDMAILSQFNGGDTENYTNTVFDDEASALIVNGSGPFTGSYQPQGGLGQYDGDNIQGDWVLVIYDQSDLNTGTLIDWSIIAQYELDATAINNSNNTAGYKLYQNIPNPTNSSTQIKFDLPEATQVSINIFDISGRLVKTLVNQKFHQGTQEVTLQSNSLKAGHYYYKMTCAKYTETRKMIIQ
ncbi:MAG: M20/M25/M40 family metallo-hydrolase [Bacteroidales bacterium]|nr:M20/M25/M40 family metallo-hydrolase [Bacteroidales bacterium]